MSRQRLSDELRAAVAADDELRDAYPDAVPDAFLARLETELDRRRLSVARAAVHIVIALGSIGLGVVLALVARDLGAVGGTVATVAGWAAILAINVVHARAAGPPGGR